MSNSCLQFQHLEHLRLPVRWHVRHARRALRALAYIERLMQLSARSAAARTRTPAIYQRLHPHLRQQSTVGDQGHIPAEGAGMANQFFEVTPQEGFAAGKGKLTTPKALCRFSNQCFRLHSRQFILGIANTVLPDIVAVDAGQIAPRRDLIQKRVVRPRGEQERRRVRTEYMKIIHHRVCLTTPI